MLWVTVLFFPKNADFFAKKCPHQQKKGVLVLKSIFSESTYVCIRTYQFQVSSINPTSFRQGQQGVGNFTGSPLAAKQIPKKASLLRVNIATSFIQTLHAKVAEDGITA